MALAATFLPRKWRRAPTSPVIVDQSNPFASGLVLAYLPGLSRFAIGGSLLELAALSTTAWGRVATPAGPAAYAITSSVSTVTAPAAARAQQVTVAWIGNFSVSAGATGGSYLFGCRYLTTNTAPFTCWGLARNSGTNAIYTRTNNGSSAVNGTTYTISPFDRTIVASCSIKDGLQYLYESGIRRVSGTTALASIAYGASAPIGFQIGNTGYTGVNHVHGAMWSGIRDGGWHEAWAENPWQIFKPLNEPRFISIGGGPVAPTLSFPTVVDIGQTSARPRVTLDFA